MDSILSSLHVALIFIYRFDGDLWEIILLSLQVSLSAVAFASILALPLSAMMVIYRFPLRGFITNLLNAMMGFPPVVMGLVVYLLLSRQGPLGVWGLLYTPTAMIIAQSLLVLPIIAALARQSLDDLHQNYQEQLALFALPPFRYVAFLLYEGRQGLITAILAGFGRAIAEVGAVMIVGGNIDHHTRVMTTAIALETSKGELSMALALGLILLLLAFFVNAMLGFLQKKAM